MENKNNSERMKNLEDPHLKEWERKVRERYQSVARRLYTYKKEYETTKDKGKRKEYFKKNSEI